MKILIAGSDLNAKLLAQYLKIEDENHDIYVTTEEKSSENFYTCVNIKENDILSICDFVKYNQIEFTIATSPIAIINGIADEFKKEGFPIFAPFSEAARVTYFNSIAKKILYKLKINTPKFGIFDRENMAIDYIRRTKFPIIVENDLTLFSRENYKYDTFQKAKVGIQKIFENDNNKIVIENYINGDDYYLYFITDGYNAIPLISLERKEGNNYTTIIAPSKKISEEIIIKILQRAIYPLLDDITKYADMYVGLIGLKIKIYKDTFYVLEIYNGFQEYDLQVFISLLKENFCKLLFDTANCCLTDNHKSIKITNNYSYSIILNKKEIDRKQEGSILNEDEFIIIEDKDNLIYTANALTINRAKDKLFNFLENNISEEKLRSIIFPQEEKE